MRARAPATRRPLSSAAGGEATAISADLAVHAEVERLARDAEDAFGGVDLLVNSASVFPAERLDEVDEEGWDHTLAVNLKAPFFLTQRLGTAMKRRGEGVGINLGDLAGLQAWEGYAVHSIAKAGVPLVTQRYPPAAAHRVQEKAEAADA